MKRLIKSIVACVIIATSIVNISVPVKADEEQYMVIESTSKKQYTNMYSLYTSFDVITGILFWSKRETWHMTARFKSADRIMIRNVSGTVRWKGKEEQGTAVLQYTKSVTVESISSEKVTDKLRLTIPIYASTVSAEIGGEYVDTRKFSATETKSFTTTLTKNSQAGYYAIISAVNADLFNVTLTCGSKEEKGKMYKMESGRPYLEVHRSDKSF